MKGISTKEKVKAINERFGRVYYQYDKEGRIFEIDWRGEPEYVSGREINRLYKHCVRSSGINGKSYFKKRVNRKNRHKEKILTKDEEKADNLSGIVHRGDIWDID